MKIGKMGIKNLKETIIDKINFQRDDVLLHADIGEDSAVVDFGDQVLVISSDPITGAEADAGFIAVNVTCNDLAATGAKPIGLQVILLLPESTSEEKLSNLMEEIHDTAAELEVEILGGHTEILSSVEKPLIVLTGVGKADKDNYIATGGAQPGDDIILTKGVGIEGTYILASDYAEYLQKQGVSSQTLNKARKFKNKLSVLKEGLIAASMGANALHDVTEGGLYGTLEELSVASETGFEVFTDAFYVAPCTEEITKKTNIDPGGLISSGSMLISIPEGEKLVAKLESEDINARIIGNIRNNGKYIGPDKDKLQKFNRDIEDELWKFIRRTAQS